MENNSIQIVQADADNRSETDFSFRRFWRRCLKNWHWFVISVFLCLGAVSLYILKTRPVYTRGAEILLKEAASRRMTSSDIESVLSFSGGTMSSKVANEVIVFKSPALMQEVVKRLNLTTDYALKSFFRSNVVYGVQVPVGVEFIDIPENQFLTFTLEKTSEDEFQVSKFTYYKDRKKYKSATFRAKMCDTLDTAVGKMRITPNAFWSGEWKKPLIVRHLTLSAATGMYSTRLKSSAANEKEKSDVLFLSIREESVQRADDIINTLINVYNESWVEDKNKMAISTSRFIKERLISLESELSEVDDEISGFKSRNLVTSANAASDLYVTRMRDNVSQIQKLLNEQYIFKYVKSFLEENPGTETLVPASASINSSHVAKEIADYNTLLLNRNSLRSNSSETNPLVQDVNDALRSMREAIIIGVDSQLDAISAQIDNIRKFEKDNDEQMSKDPENAKYLLSFGRQQKVKESLYLYLLQKREENELSQAFTAYNTRVITPPMGNAVPTSPKRMQLILMALFLGLFAPLAAMYILELTDSKVHEKSDLSLLTLPCLGEVPQHTRENRKGLRVFKGTDGKLGAQILVQPKKRDITNEAFRVIRTNLEFMTKGGKCPVIIACSFVPGSGKTFLTANLCAALAIKGIRVLAIDGDFRKGNLSEYVGSPKKGLSDFLAGDESDISKLIVGCDGIAGMDVLPVGILPPNPTELICKPKFTEMVEKLKSRYDYILIDCPPVDIVADTQLIAQCADRTVFVARAGVMDRSEIEALQKAYDTARFKNLCYVFNGAQTISSRYGKYGYGYGYGYGK